ncbi:hypothetical protein KAR91_44885 [Candidatus Pacearchaeota archaeon]|nr:hypothetical protein [Candidatus Pacearchaeota archaeon]
MKYYFITIVHCCSTVINHISFIGKGKSLMAILEKFRSGLHDGSEMHIVHSVEITEDEFKEWDGKL